MKHHSKHNPAPSYRRSVNRQREQRGLNRIEIPLCVQRDLILESDRVYEANMKAALHRLRQRKITSRMFGHLRNFHIADALRRARVNLQLAGRMVAAA